MTANRQKDTKLRDEKLKAVRLKEFFSTTDRRALRDSICVLEGLHRVQISALMAGPAP